MKHAILISLALATLASAVRIPSPQDSDDAISEWLQKAEKPREFFGLDPASPTEEVSSAAQQARTMWGRSNSPFAETVNEYIGVAEASLQDEAPAIMQQQPARGRQSINAAPVRRGSIAPSIIGSDDESESKEPLREPSLDMGADNNPTLDRANTAGLGRGASSSDGSSRQSAAFSQRISSLQQQSAQQDSVFDDEAPGSYAEEFLSKPREPREIVTAISYLVGSRLYEKKRDINILLKVADQDPSIDLTHRGTNLILRDALALQRDDIAKALLGNLGVRSSVTKDWILRAANLLDDPVKKQSFIVMASRVVPNWEPVPTQNVRKKGSFMAGMRKIASKLSLN